MASSADSMVRDAIKAYHAGNPEEARNLLFKAVEVDEANEQAWLWLSAVVEADSDKQTCLENVLTINPNNDKAKQGLRILRDKANTAPPPPEPSSPLLVEDDPFANVSFTQPTTSTSEMAAASPFSMDDEDEDEEELPTNVSWGSVETSSASAAPPRAEPGPAEYEDWISNLNIGGNEAQETFGDEENGDPALNSAPFIGGDDMFGSDSPFELDDSFFGLDDPAFESSAEALGSPFSADIVEDAPPAPVSPPPSSPVPQSAPPPMSPVPERDDSSRPDPLMESIAAEDEEDFGFLDDSAFDDAGFTVLDPEEYFAYIPSEIKATRLPGTNERYPAAMTLSLMLLLVLNIGALVLVFITLTGA